MPGLTPEQFNALGGGANKPLTPEEFAALGSPKTDPHQGAKDFINSGAAPGYKPSVGNKIANVGLGAVKGLVGGTAQTGMNVFGPVANRIADPISRAVGIKNSAPPIQQSTPESWKTTSNTAQKIGYGAEQVAEALLPIGGATKEGSAATGRFGERIPQLVDYLKPTLTKGEEAAAKEAGQIQTKGLFRKVIQKSTPQDFEMARAAKEAGVKSTESFDKNVAKINDALKQHTSNIISKLEQRGAIYNPNQFKGALTKIERPVMVASDDTLARAYDRVTNKALDMESNIGKKTKANLFKSRLEFDSYIKREFPNLYKDERLTPMRQAVRDIRTAWNKIVSQGLPKSEYNDVMRKETLLFDARENIASKAPKLGTNALKQFAQSPAGKGLKYGLEAVGGYEVAKKLHIVP